MRSCPIEGRYTKLPTFSVGELDQVLVMRPVNSLLPGRVNDFPKEEMTGSTESWHGQTYLCMGIPYKRYI